MVEDPERAQGSSRTWPTPGRERRTPPPDRVRVLIVDDQPIIVAGLTASLEAAGDIEVVGHTADAARTQLVLTAERVDIVLLNLHLPDDAAADLLRDGKEKSSRPAILLLSPFASRECVSAAIELGAAGFLLTTSTVGSIVRAVRAIRSGGRAFTAQQLRDASRARWTPLSPREHQIVAGLVRGRSNDELSVELGVSRKTIELHLTRLFMRFGVLSRTELAVRVEREQILKLPVGDPVAPRFSSLPAISRSAASPGFPG